MRLGNTAGEPGGQTGPAGRRPSGERVIFGSSITSTVIVAFVLNLAFNHWTWRQPRADDAIDEALRYGAVSADGQQTG